MISHMTRHNHSVKRTVWEREGQDYIIYLFVFLLEQQSCRMRWNQTAMNIAESYSTE